jgi:hypothetical protein
MMKKFNLSQIMSKAWELFRTTGKTFADCLRESWKMAKMISIGNLWEKYGKRRVYFNQKALLDLCKVEISYYKTGNVSSCSVDGSWTSNADGRRWLSSTDGVYYDLDRNGFYGPRSSYLDEVVTALRKFLKI